MKLFHRRAYWLYRAVGMKQRGAPPLFSATKVKPQVKLIVKLARKILVRQRAQKALNQFVSGKKSCRFRHLRRSEKRAHFQRWCRRQKHCPNCVYVFWHGRTCLYVGRTIRGHWHRPHQHFKRTWFRLVTRVDVYNVKSPSLVPAAECLAIDLFDPKHNTYSASNPKHSKKCPVCTSANKVKRELKRLFPLRRRRRRCRVPHSERALWLSKGWALKIFGLQPWLRDSRQHLRPDLIAIVERPGKVLPTLAFHLHMRRALARFRLPAGPDKGSVNFACFGARPLAHATAKNNFSGMSFSCSEITFSASAFTLLKASFWSAP